MISKFAACRDMSVIIFNEITPCYNALWEYTESAHQLTKAQPTE